VLLVADAAGEHLAASRQQPRRDRHDLCGGLACGVDHFRSPGAPLAFRVEASEIVHRQDRRRADPRIGLRNGSEGSEGG
jgi:hypothetical protein